MPEREIEFPFQHPAADEANRLFLKIDFSSAEGYRNLPRRDRYLWDISWFETQVMNGGIDQYFYNSSGNHAIECLQALQGIGATQSYKFLKAGCDLFPDGRPSPDQELRQEQLRKITGGERYLDDMVKGDIEVNLYQLLLDYYRAADATER